MHSLHFSKAAVITNGRRRSMNSRLALDCTTRGPS